MANAELQLGAVDPPKVTAETRRAFLLFGAGALAAAGGFLFVMPTRVRQRLLGGHAWLDSLEARRRKAMGGVLSFDDDVAEALYSPSRTVRTYRRSDVTPSRTTYNG